jgi:hypothetical protein
MLRRLNLFSTYLARAMSVVGLTSLMFLASLTLTDGLMRWLFDRPIEGVRDAGGLAIALGVSCCIPIGLMERSNITIRFAATIVGAGIGNLLDLLGSVLTGVVVVGMACEFFLYAGKLRQAGEMTWILHIPTAPFWYGVAGILSLSALVQAIVIAGDCAKVWRSATHEEIHLPQHQL